MYVKIKKCLNCGIKHDWDFEGPTLKEMRIIKRVAGFNGEDFATSSSQADPEALAALLYILHLRDKIKLDFEEIDLDFTDFEMEETEEEKKERETQEKAAELENKVNDNPKGKK